MINVGGTAEAGFSTHASTRLTSAAKYRLIGASGSLVGNAKPGNNSVHFTPTGGADDIVVFICLACMRVLWHLLCKSTTLDHP